MLARGRSFIARWKMKVAIKTMASGALADPAMRERFDREARAVAARSHPNILTQLPSRIQSDVAAMRARADYSGLP